ncbi:hypothetical protein GCM10009809_38120 [Isoptericola hypogeus]|uniref:Site-specific recombinase XerD n=1 Tax=Isoptericola hypogeus TaxID=300179 RepID=A0ABN2JU59_9MICO
MASVEKRTRLGRDGKAVVTWVTRWRDPDGRQRMRSFARKTDAERKRREVDAELLRGEYVDPTAGQVTFRAYASTWLAAQTFDASTHDAVELRLRVHAFPTLGDHTLAAIKPSTVQAWLRHLGHLAVTTRQVIFANVSAVFSAAVDDELIRKNPCKAPSVSRPKGRRRKVVPWTAERVFAVRDALPERYRIVVSLGAGLGIRQGEIFGLAVDDVDFLAGRVTVRRQVKLFHGNRRVFALPKNEKIREVPLPESIRDDLAAHLARYPAAKVTLPWKVVSGEPASARLIVTSRERKALNRNYFNSHVWKRALAAASGTVVARFSATHPDETIPDSVPIQPVRENGMHALRHHYASVLLDAGESIKALSEYLGHSDAGFTLRVYTHLMPSSDERTRRAIDAVFRGKSVGTLAPSEVSSQISA